MSARGPLCPKAFSVARPWTESRNSAAKPGIGGLPHARIGDVELVPQRRQQQRRHREAEQHGGDRQVDPGDEGEDQHRRQRRDHQLRQVLAEIGFELLHPVDQRKRQRAGAPPRGVGRAERGDAVEQVAAQPLLDDGRRPVRRHRAPVLEGAAQDHDGGDGRRRRREFGQRLAREHPPDQPAEQRQPGHAQPGRDEADRHREEDAAANAPGEAPQARFEMHGAASRRRGGRLTPPAAARRSPRR